MNGLVRGTWCVVRGKKPFSRFFNVLRTTYYVLFLFSASLAAQEIYQEVTVQPGDTMWSIANKYLKDPQRWPDIVRANNLSAADPTVALPGTRIRIPVLLIKEEYRTAQLVSLIPEVRYKRKEGAEWLEARADMTLRYDDNLRTMSGAQARVRFPSKEVVQINENSYVVLKPEKILQQIQLLSGDIRASRARVLMPQGTVVEPKSSQSDYRAKVRPDETEVVFVYKGNVAVTAQGKTVTVKEGFGTQVPKSAPPSAPMPLSSFPDFNPADMASQVASRTKIDSAKGTVKVSAPLMPTPKTEESPSGKSKSVMAKDIMSSYKLQLAADENFRRIVLEKTEKVGTGFDIKKVDVADGVYYMRVAFIDALGVAGKYSAPAAITKDTQPPKVISLSPREGDTISTKESFCEVGGVIEDAALVSINGDVVFISASGQFSKTVSLREGSNSVRVVARDVSGNETRIDRKIYYTRPK